MSESEFVTKVAPDEVFGLLASDIRIDIVQTLWETDTQLSFSELHSQVGMRDSGQFNYHLDKLVGRFVRQTDDGYELTQAGKQINGAIERGAYTMRATVDPIELQSPCTLCGGAQRLEYEDEVVCIHCTDCPTTHEFVVPPGVLAEYDRHEIPDAASRYLRATFFHISKGFCTFCEGAVTSRVKPLTEIDEIPTHAEDEIGVPPEKLPMVSYECQRCNSSPTAGLSFVLLYHPAVIGFFYDHGINVETVGLWDSVEAEMELGRIHTHEPFRAGVKYSVGEETLTVVVDEQLTVVETDRAMVR